MRVACLQLSSVREQERNFDVVDKLLGEAVQEGVELALLPENFASMGCSDQQKRSSAEEQHDSSVLRFLAEQAEKHGVAIIGGTLLLKGAGDKLRNTCPVFDARGKLLTVYDKIHLFDMDYQDEFYHESALIEAGDVPVSVSMGHFKIGLSICYDLRFPELYRSYIEEGCHVLSNVAAFTATTGHAHWQALLRARAIENQCMCWHLHSLEGIPMAGKPGVTV
ncbi:omega-amidase [Mariprofundus micogutta]|uniref:Omega-amidase n=1 Tax=Mariprofundus micogutta TaxID=1921010 RepID=A0A1L8CJL5_9PROT|nr:nitrilase-related carbon-nitrogen hydrolase [Mariprofundus micogutta]GAV19114.1 omega-amidase [Mariprofundus micogutta]